MIVLVAGDDVLTYSYNPKGAWTGTHKMSLNGKRDDFTLDDFRSCARQVAMKRGRAEEILDEVRNAVREWPAFGKEAGVPDRNIRRIGKTHRMQF